MNPAFEPVPADINFFISHPFITGLLTNTMSLMILVTLSLFVLYISIRQLIRKRTWYLVLAVAAILSIGSLAVTSRKARYAVNPDAQTIIAAIVRDKQVLQYGLCKEYYLITEIEGKRYGVATSKDIFLMDRYQPGATFDYSLYTYRTASGFILFRFLKPEFKVKAPRGNLQ